MKKLLRVTCKGAEQLDASMRERLGCTKQCYDGAVDQSVSVFESPEDKRDRLLQRTLRASAVRVDLRLATIESEYSQSKCYKEKVSARPV